MHDVRDLSAQGIAADFRAREYLPVEDDERDPLLSKAKGSHAPCGSGTDDTHLC